MRVRNYYKNITVKVKQNLKMVKAAGLYSIFLLAFLTSKSAFAHCPNQFLYQSKSYCMDYEWSNAQQRRGADLRDLDKLSPVINAFNVKPHRREMSALFFRIWEEGDSEHKPVYFENFRVFPYMQMTDGMHHPGSSNTDYVVDYNGAREMGGVSGYLINQITFFDMPIGGCWSLRYTFSDDNNVSESFKITNIETYNNVDQGENIRLLSICDICGLEEPEAEIVSEGMAGHHDHH